LLIAEAAVNIGVNYVYGDPLLGLGEWWRMLWAESTAKAERLDGTPNPYGMTPVVARGSSDQHSQNQLYLDGPDDKLYVFTSCAQWPADPPLDPAPGVLPPGLSGITGRSFAQLLQAGLAGTQGALTEAGRPVCGITLPRCGPHEIGAYMQLWMLAAAYAGMLAGINPFDQPGVERSKAITMKELSLWNCGTDRQPAAQ
jgi:glucose-6-phosphate isomerase